MSERDQNYTRAINHLVQELSAEKKELEAELELKMDQEVMLVRWVWPKGLFQPAECYKNITASDTVCSLDIRNQH